MLMPVILASPFRHLTGVDNPADGERDADDDLDTRARSGAVSVAALHGFTLLCTMGPSIALYALHVREVGGQWRNALRAVMSDNDGEISVLLGAFTPGTRIEIFFGVLAVTDAIPKVATYIVRDGGTPSKLAPSPHEGFKALARGERWEATVAYAVPGVIA